MQDGIGQARPGPGLMSQLILPQIRADAKLKSWNVYNGTSKDLLGVFLRSRQRVIRQLGTDWCDI